MAKKFLTGLNLVVLDTDPDTGFEGELYFNSSASVAKIYQAGSWSILGAGGGGTTVSTTEPASPEIGDSWYKNDTGEFYIYDGTYWVEVNGVISLSQEEVQDYVSPLFIHSNHTNINATYDDDNNEIILNTSGSLISIDSIVYPDYITFDTTPEIEPFAQGSLWWNEDQETLNIQLDENVVLPVGESHVIKVKNNSASVSIPKMRVVMFSGATGDTVQVTPALSTALYEPELLVGITAEEILADGFGFVMQFGFIKNVNTSTPGWSLGDLLYIDPESSGLLTNVKPSAPNWTFPIAAVTRVHESTGIILVRIIPGKHLHDIVDVLISASVQNNELLAYDLSNGVWINKTSEEAGLLNTSEIAQTKSGDLTLTGKNSIYDGREYLYAVNDELDTVSKLSAVFFNGVSLDGTPKFKLADLTHISQPGVVGLTTEDTLTGQTGTIITRGIIDGIDTSSYSDGTILYVSTNGTLTQNRPSGVGSRIHKIAKVVIADETDGKIYVFGNIEEDLPNLEEGKVWIGDLNDQPQESILDTTLVPEGTNLYFTDQRSVDALSSTLSNYLTLSSASTVYLEKDDASFTYLTKDDASSTYLTQSSASSTYLTEESDPIFTASDSFNITSASTSSWNTAYGWGDHSTAGYSLDSHNHTLDSLSNVEISGLDDGDSIVWNSASSKWINQVIEGDSVDLSEYLKVVDVFGTEDEIEVLSNSGSVTIGLPENITVSGNITISGNPTDSNHAVTKLYVDDIAQGIVTKPSVYAATTASLDATYANGTLGVGATLTSNSNGSFPLIDGVQLSTANGLRGLLVKNQSNPAQNGRYNLTTLGTESTPWILTRCTLCDESDEIPGMYAFVSSGSVNGGKGFVAIVENPSTFTIGTDSIIYTQFSDTGQIQAGTNLDKVGQTLNVIDSPVFSGIVSASSAILSTPLSYEYGGTGLSTLGTAGQSIKVNEAEDGLEWGDSGGAGGLYVSDTAPPSPTEGIGWYNNETGKLFVFDGTYWVEATNNLTDEDIMDTVAQMIADGTHSNIDITYNDLSNSLSFNVLSEPITDFLTLNEDLTGLPTDNAGIIVNRGDLTDVVIRFNETEDSWEFTNDGIEYQAIGSGGGAVSTNTSLSNSFWLGA